MRERVGRGIGATLVAVLVAAVPSGPRAQSAAGSLLPGEWMLDRPSAEVFAAARDTARAMGFRIDRDDAASGLLVTRQARYGADWPSAEALGLAITQTPDTATLHVYVAPGFEPARLAVGAVLGTATVFVPYRLPIARGRQTFYKHEPFAALVAERIAARLGRTLEPLSSDPDERARRTARSGSGREATCGPAAVATGTSPDEMPRGVHTVKPEYPKTALFRHVGGAVQLRAELTEHGTLTAIERSAGVEDRNLVAAAIGAAGLWRFTPIEVNGCPARSRIGIQMSFSMR